jgi:hypothetical protein
MICARDGCEAPRVRQTRLCESHYWAALAPPVGRRPAPAKTSISRNPAAATERLERAKAIEAYRRSIAERAAQRREALARDIAGMIRDAGAWPVSGRAVRERYGRSGAVADAIRMAVERGDVFSPGSSCAGALRGYWPDRATFDAAAQARTD